MKLLMFPGQGSQYLGMGKLWCAEFREAAAVFEEASDALQWDLKKICFESDAEALKKTEITQPAILTTTIAAFRVIEKKCGLDKSKYIFAGHSLGEYSALVAMGALSLFDAATLVNHRGKYMQEAVPQGVGAMAALVFKPKLDGSALSKKLCETVNAMNMSSANGGVLEVSVANVNSPEQIVISGHKEAVLKAKEIAESDASYSVRKVVELPVSAPFHCALMKPAADRLMPEIVSAKWTPHSYRYIANVDAAIHDASDAKAISDRLYQQISGSVRWVESIQAALRSEVTSAVEIGPGKVLQGLAKRISFKERTLNAAGIDTVEEFIANESIFA